MIGCFDMAFCLNRTCTQWGSSSPCGRSVKNFEGHPILLDIYEFRPDDSGKCKNYMEPTDWVSKIEPWMEELAKGWEERHNAEVARRKQRKDADDPDKEV